jgi:hypothetical protein
VFVDWRCVFDDGTRPFAPGIDQEQRRPLRIVTGDELVIRVELITPGGAPVALDAGEVLAWMAKTVGEPSRRILAKQSTSGPPGSGRYLITIPTAETRVLPVGAAVHDLFAIRGDARHVVIPISALVIARSSLGGA